MRWSLALGIVVATACAGGGDSAGEAKDESAGTIDSASELERRDTDGDGFPDVADCGPADPTVYPGAPETCNRIDDDCDGVADNDPVDPVPVYADLDGDGYGDDTAPSTACSTGPDQADRPGDCDDTDPAVNPSAREACWTGKDEDCDGDPGFCGPSGAPTTAALTARWWGAAGDRFGTSAAWGLDPGGSGQTVLVVGAPDAALGSGGVSVLVTPTQTGGAGQLAAVGSGVDHLGTVVRSVGDLDADGYGDVVAGAPGADGARGAVVLLLGGPDGLGPASPLATGATAGDAIGTALGVGDANADGQLDLAIGIPDTPSTAFRGGVVLLSGPLAAGGPTIGGLDARVVGTEPGGRAGLGVALSGDCDGDGHDDLLIGAPREGAGRFAIVAGPLTSTVLLDDADYRYDSDGTAFDLGWDVAWLGDSDGDGTDDLVVSAPGGSLDGAVLVFYGSDVLASDGMLDSGTVGAAILGTGYAAGAVAPIGDVNGDGRPDVHAGGPGVHWSPLAGGIDAEDADLWLTAATTADGRDVPGWLPAHLGPSASPDVDGDGYAELIFAGPGLSPHGQASAGEVQVLSPAGF